MTARKLWIILANYLFSFLHFMDMISNYLSLSQFSLIDDIEFKSFFEFIFLKYLSSRWIIIRWMIIKSIKMVYLKVACPSCYSLQSIYSFANILRLYIWKNGWFSFSIWCYGTRYLFYSIYLFIYIIFQHGFCDYLLNIIFVF